MNRNNKEREYFEKIHQEYGHWAHMTRVRAWVFDMQEKVLLKKEITEEEKQILKKMDSLIPSTWF